MHTRPKALTMTSVNHCIIAISLDAVTQAGREPTAILLPHDPTEQWRLKLTMETLSFPNLPF